MGKPAARIADMHTCPMVTGVVPHVGGPVLMGCPTVIVGGMPQARITDTCTCVGPPDMIAIRVLRPQKCWPVKSFGLTIPEDWRRK